MFIKEPNINKLNDTELAELLLSKKPLRDRVFVFIYEKYSTGLNSFCLFLCKNKVESEELFHRSWISFFEYVQKGNTIESIPAFITKCARNIFLNDIKFKKRESDKLGRFAIEFDIEEKMQLQNVLSNNDNKIAIIYSAIDSLDEIYKEAFVLRRFNDFSTEEIALVTGQSVECIKKRLSRASQKVQHFVHKYLNESNKKRRQENELQR